MATFSGRNSPTALAALAPSINNLAAARNAKSQAAAGLVKTMGVQFEKQREKEARKQKNQAAQQVAEKLLQDPAFRRQAPGITDSAGLVKLVGADNVVKFGLETQQADRVAQESATRINLTNKQIEQYDIDTRQRESDEASSKAFASLVGNMYGSDEFTQEDLKLGLQNLSSTDALKAVGIYNQNNPENALQIIEKDGRRVLYNKVTGRMEFMDEDASQLSREHKSQEAAVMADNSLTPEQKQARIQQLSAYYQVPRDELGDPMPGFGGAAGGPTPAEAPITLPVQIANLYKNMPDEVLASDEMVDKYLSQYADILTDEENQAFKSFVAQERINRAEEKREEELNARIEANNPDKPGVVESYLKNLTIPGFSDPISSMIPDMDVLRKAYQEYAIDPLYNSPGGPSGLNEKGSQIVKGIKDYMMGGESQSSTPPKVLESQRNRPSPQINRTENLNPNQPRTSMLDRAGQGPLATSLKRTVKDLSSRIKAYEESGKSFNFNLAKQIAKERAKREAGRNAPEVVKELSKMTIEKINKKPKNESEAKAQSSFQKAIMEVLEMEGPITSYGDPRMKSSVTPVE